MVENDVIENNSVPDNQRRVDDVDLPQFSASHLDGIENFVGNVAAVQTNSFESGQKRMKCFENPLDLIVALGKIKLQFSLCDVKIKKQVFFLAVKLQLSQPGAAGHYVSDYRDVIDVFRVCDAEML